MTNQKNEGLPQAAGAKSRSLEFGIVAGMVVLAVVAVLLAQFAGMARVQALAGAVVILGIAYLASTNRKAIHLPTVAWGLGLQIAFALVVLKTTAGQVTFQTLGEGINRLLSFAGVGAAVNTRI